MELVEIIFKNEYYLHILLWFEKLIDFFEGSREFVEGWSSLSWWSWWKDFCIYFFGSKN